jgi:hypothetical protein
MEQPRGEMPVTDEYFALLAGAQTPEEVEILMEMHAADVAERNALLAKHESAETLVGTVDGTIFGAQDVIRMIQNGHQRPGSYDGAGRRA